MDDVDLILVRHIAGAYDHALGQLCSRCGMVLSAGERQLAGPLPAPGLTAYAVEPCFPFGLAVMVSTDSAGRFRVTERMLKADRDRSDEADCESIVDLAPADCTCGHRPSQHTFPDAPGGAGCWSCDCTEYSEEET